MFVALVRPEFSSLNLLDGQITLDFNSFDPANQTAPAQVKSNKHESKSRLSHKRKAGIFGGGLAVSVSLKVKQLGVTSVKGQ